VLPQNRDVLMNMLRTRYEIASALGYKSWADYNAADKMIGNGGADRGIHSRPRQGRAPGYGQGVSNACSRKRENPTAKPTTIGLQEKSY